MASLLVAKWLPNTAFTTNTGTGFINDGWAVAVQADGKIVVGGWFTTLNGKTSNRIARLDGPAKFPDAPTLTSITGGDRSATVGFTPGATGGDPITNYEYQVGSGSWTPSSPATTTSPVTIDGLTNGTEVAIKLRAVNGVGPGAASDTVQVTPALVVSAPGRTTNLPLADAVCRPVRVHSPRHPILLVRKKKAHDTRQATACRTFGWIQPKSGSGSFS